MFNNEAFVWFLRIELLEGLPRRLCEQDLQTTVSEHTVCFVGERGDRKDFLYFQQYSFDGTYMNTITVIVI